MLDVLAFNCLKHTKLQPYPQQDSPDTGCTYFRARYPDLLPSFIEIVRQSSPVDCEAVQGSQLHKMGLVHLYDLKTSLACELFVRFSAIAFLIY
ncbi:MAG: AAA-like domain-containing protein [Nostoc sp.]|uniref:AAA-like domain-containing protein n=1 Tax=Nostoc sp. TaxID=1180 RepID=UPI002FFC6179